MLPSKFGVNWPFGSGEEAKNRFSRWRHGFSYFFYLQVTPMLSTKFQINWPRGVGGIGFVDAARRTTHDGHRLITTAHHEHFVDAARRTTDDGHRLITTAHHFALRTQINLVWNLAPKELIIYKKCGTFCVILWIIGLLYTHLLIYIFSHSSKSFYCSTPVVFQLINKSATGDSFALDLIQQRFFSSNLLQFSPDSSWMLNV